MSESSFNRVSNRHLDYFESLDALLAEQDAMNAEMHTIVEQNGLDDITRTEEQLIWESFNAVFHKENPAPFDTGTSPA